MKTTLYLTIPLMILVMTACNTKDNAGKYHTQDAMDAIFARTSIRSYQPQAVEEEKIELLLKAGMAAPSGKNVQPWELVVVDDRAALDVMAAALPYAKMLAQAPMAIVVCADTTKSSYWYVDCSAVAENILLAAQALGLGAVWTATYPYADTPTAWTWWRRRLLSPKPSTPSVSFPSAIRLTVRHRKTNGNPRKSTATAGNF